jgi:hypothetical protein
MTRKDLDGTSRAEYPFGAAPTTSQETRDYAHNGGDARTVGSDDGHRVLADYGHGQREHERWRVASRRVGISLARGRRPRAALRARDSTAAPVL